MASIFGYIRTSRRLQEGVPGMDPASLELQFRRAGVPQFNIYRDVGVSGTTGTQGRQGWHQLDGRLAGGDTLVVVAIDRIGRTWQDIARTICVSIRERSVAGQAKARAEGRFPGRRPSLNDRQREYIRAERSKGVSQRDLAKRLAVSRWTIQQVDR